MKFQRFERERNDFFASEGLKDPNRPLADLLLSKKLAQFSSCLFQDFSIEINENLKEIAVYEPQQHRLKLHYAKN